TDLRDCVAFADEDVRAPSICLESLDLLWLLLKQLTHQLQSQVLMAPGTKTKVVRVIARLNVGGPAKHVVWLTQGLQQSSIETLLIAGTVPEGEEDMGYFADEMGITPHYVREMSREISLKDAVTVWKLYRLFRREHPDIIHTHTAKAGTVGRVAGFFYRWATPATLIGQPRKCKFVHTYHGHIFHSYYGPSKTRLFIFIERLLARMITDRLLVVSAQQQQEIHEKFGIGRNGQFHVVPLGLDLKVFDNAATRRHLFRQELGLSDDVLLVGIVGRLTDIKDHDFFLRAVARFKELPSDRLPRLKFVVIGDGSLRADLEKLSESLGLGSDVVFAGNRRDPQNFYPALDIVALTSKNEGTPLTLIEAMANARPVIATSVGGVVDLLGEPLPTKLKYLECTRGISVTPGDLDGFAAGLQRLVEDKELRTKVAQNGYDFVRSNYAKERLLEDIKGLYAELMSPQLAKVEPGPAEGVESRA
ncbi:MAG TPA: glycosyltransferase, partial [Pyrinomonadaceae bacterium]|nr:glycosyltransferase [Pyrinomonadaceae bacterium]